MNNIDTAFKPFDTAKIRLGYLPHYDEHFAPIEVKSFLELGVHEGQSLRAWQEYFPDAHIVGIDISIQKRARELLAENPERIFIRTGSADDHIFIDKIISEFDNFDIVLDDCSHVGLQMQKSFELLWPHTNYMYVIEDLDTQFGKHGSWFTKGGSFIDNFIRPLLPQNDHFRLTEDRVADNVVFDNILDKTIGAIVFQHYMVFIYRKGVPVVIPKKRNPAPMKHAKNSIVRHKPNFTVDGKFRKTRRPLKVTIEYGTQTRPDPPTHPDPVPVPKPLTDNVVHSINAWRKKVIKPVPIQYSGEPDGKPTDKPRKRKQRGTKCKHNSG